MAGAIAIGAVAVGPADAGPDRCRAEAEASVLRLAAAGVRLAVLPELFDEPYAAAADPSSRPDAGEPLDGPRARWAGRIADRTGISILYGAAVDGGGGRPLNAAVLAAPGRSAVAVAAKIHLPPAGDGDAFGEADHFDPAPPAVRTFDVGRIRVAALVCYDRRFPECWRRAAAAGAHCVAVLVAGPAPSDPAGLFRAELMTHARANGVFALAASRFGTETVTGRPVRHDGETVAFDPDGRLIAAVPADHPGEILITVDPAASRAARRRNATAARLRLPSDPVPRRSA